MTLAVQESKCLRDFKKLQKCLSLSRGVFFWNLCCLPAISVFSALVTSLWAESNSRGKQQSPEVMWGCLEQDRVGGVGGRCSPGGRLGAMLLWSAHAPGSPHIHAHNFEKRHSKSAPLHKWGDTHKYALKTALKTQKWHEDKNNPGSLSIYSRRIEVIFL